MAIIVTSPFTRQLATSAVENLAATELDHEFFRCQTYDFSLMAISVLLSSIL